MRTRIRVLILTATVLAACGGAAPEQTGANGAGEPADTSVASDPATLAMTVPSMSCPLCSRSIEARLKEAGLRDIHIDLEAKRVTAVFDPSRITAEEVKALVEGQGFPVTESRLVEQPALEEEG